MQILGFTRRGRDAFVVVFCHKYYRYGFLKLSHVHKGKITKDGRFFKYRDRSACLSPQEYLRQFVPNQRPDGYWRITKNKKHILWHREVWFAHYGKYPEDEIDHIDRDINNNHISNLREADRSLNMSNLERKPNTNIYKTGSKKNPEKRSVNVGNTYLGTFNSYEEARIARDTFLKKEK